MVETILQMIIYAGFPVVLNAIFTLAQEVFESRKAGKDGLDDSLASE